nr:venom dipeptidyl peptidase 4 [Leptinotarsa decemlineata]
MTGNSGSAANGNSNFEIAQSNQDLITSKRKNRKRKWLLIGVTVVLAVIILLAAIIIVATRKKNSKVGPTAASLTLDDFLHGKFLTKGFNGTWTSGDDLIYSDSNGNIVLLNLQNKTSTVLIDSLDNLSLVSFDFQLSADGLYLLVASNYQKLYRHSFLALYTIIELNSGERQVLNPEKRPIQLAVWAPVGNALVYVSENNIFYKSSAKERGAIAITSTVGYVSNGVPDWVNEEEVFSSNKALWFSPDGRKLAYGRFNDTEVPLMIIPVYGEPGKLSSQYPRANVIKYPKCGAKNPTVSFHFVDLAKPEREFYLEVPNNVKGEEILSAVEWATNDILTAIWMNRVQNRASIVAYDTSQDSVSSTIIKNLVASDGWLELFTPPIFSKDGSKLVMILSQDQGGNSGYRHVVMLNVVENAQDQPLTKGKFVVTSILAWDHEENLIYYLANTESDWTVQHLYAVSAETKNVTCFTCDLKSEHNSTTACSYNTAEFSKNSSYYVLTCAGPDVPQVKVFSKNGNEVMQWSNNEELANYLKERQTASLKKMTFDIADGLKAKVLLRLPPNMDTSGQTKYPMLVNVYGGPDTYQVIDKFVLDWGSYLAANKSIIYAAIDGRGSGLKGDRTMFAGYRKLGTVEIVDQINVTRLIQKSLPYVDSSRTAIWGWSYGGYAAGMALATDTEGVFKCAISVSPVTDWALYDSVYTERFMGLPTADDNLKGYEEGQLLKKYEGLRDKEYFLIHGTHDDNVHYQQSMMWAKVLEQNDILFRQQSYPDEDHSLGLVRPHLYHSLENFLDECFLEKGD